MTFCAIILAGGLGTRMNSSVPKVLNTIAGGTLLECVIHSLSKIEQLNEIIIIGSKNLFFHEKWKKIEEKIKKKVKNVKLAIQEKPRGTGHAVQTGVPLIGKEVDRVLICCGDTPLIRLETFQKLLVDESDLTLLTMRIENPERSSYGRVIIENSHPTCIIEIKEANSKQKQIDVANAGVYGISAKCLKELIFNISCEKNKTAEIYLTDIVEQAYKRGYSTNFYEVSQNEAYGIDTAKALQNVPFKEEFFFRALTRNISFQDPDKVALSFDTEISEGCEIGAFCVFGHNVILKENVKVLPFCYLEDCLIKENSVIGPFARIKGESIIGHDAVIGNFVEVKKSRIGDKTKIKHLSYIGDAFVENSVNIGAGTIFCNYDGFQKHNTRVGQGAKIGANVSLVAPLTIGQGAFIGAGSVITQNVPDETLAVTRAKQTHNSEWLKKRQKGV
ncbi:MAG: bifunctional UDP-N-acetylglucosamine diphosphorylase/glucosamine-1-phosphate N-acetyltransferase GlmU [Holosporales bacterium]|jgi:bifunctional UDP-N-acetylglucosamine pyrophosphorylase/glucosamine-1-phosphate N-acetyltransferase|nr:bifunctional UDP-N-acetylglucosamine diphosphorylase/glucosamine-1-phosphate N-acetyltransferase GlmU [Holosporales bacterium]